MSTKLIEVIGNSSVTQTATVQDNNNRSILVITDNMRGTTVNVTPRQGNSIIVSATGVQGTDGAQGPAGPAGPTAPVRPFIATGSISASVDLGSNIFLVKSGSQTFLNLTDQGSFTVASSAQNVFLIENVNTNASILTVSQSGLIIFATQSAQLSNPAPNGGIYFTSASMFIGVD